MFVFFCGVKQITGWIKGGSKSVMFFFLNVAPALLCNFVSGCLGTKHTLKIVEKSQSINQNNNMRMILLERNIENPEYSGYLPPSVGQRHQEKQGN